ncbi:phenoloxidase-activating factor 2 isoform X2 [Drosophila sechellia]|uniref:phenoloxidase-activating factor 2 isoform X2 n=1 Tax=Drosophila sechellia TaxID=7238 RepID=UPI0013DDBCFC|nr:phenoloxidase-activating factor 2 isoform X2 [Drosophila sechellia]
MDRLSILLLLLGISRSQALFCGGSMAKECVQRNRCRIGTETGRPIIQFRGLINGNDGCESGQTCCPKTEILQFPVQVDNQPLPADCGHANHQGLGFTITSPKDMAQDGELPWMVALLDSRSRLPIGGGSLIKRDVVLTSSTKTYEVPETYLMVRAGEWDFNSDSEQRAHEDVAIRKIVRHANLGVEIGANNAALLFLARPLKLDHHINLICLPPPNWKFIHNRCIVSGWGKKTALDNSYMNALKKIDLPLVDRSVCQTQLQGPYGKDFILDNSLICAGGEPGKDSCKGDGGGPLACPLQSDPNRYELVGIVNFGFGCGEPLPAAYTDVSQIRPWIDYNIQANAVHYSPPFGNVGQSLVHVDLNGIQNGANGLQGPLQIGGNIPNVGQGINGNRYDPNTEIGAVSVGKPIPNEGNPSGGLGYDLNGIEKHNQFPPVLQGNGANGHQGPLQIGGNIPNVGQGNSGNRYVPVGKPIPNEGNVFGGLGYDLYGIQKPNQAGEFIPHVGQENHANGLQGPLQIGGNIPNIGQGNSGNRYDPNPKIGPPTFGATGAGMQGNNIDNQYNYNLGDRAENKLGAFPLENPNKDKVISPSDFASTTTTPSAPIKLVIEKY